MNLTWDLNFLFLVEVGIGLWPLKTPWRVALVNAVSSMPRSTCQRAWKEAAVRLPSRRRRGCCACLIALGQGCLAHAIAALLLPRRVASSARMKARNSFLLGVLACAMRHGGHDIDKGDAPRGFRRP
ncbi:hypothetical protein HAX54_014722 [Datura stramonium]|uniref:Uncharacterized protein n=1 Tax=Datura stramonium TaxID=4076 RepID=A0ABS8RYZ1_DATST|nr:hypothetical protein [Datura stramonium]